MTSADALPIPPLELRELVGQTDTADFDNPGGTPIWDDVPVAAWRSFSTSGAGAVEVPAASSSSVRGPSATSAWICTEG